MSPTDVPGRLDGLEKLVEAAELRQSRAVEALNKRLRVLEGLVARVDTAVKELAARLDKRAGGLLNNRPPNWRLDR